MSLTAAIMQPYLFPYIGYFQLMRAADVFVIYDDVQYMKGGWINRNRIASAGEPIWLTLPVHRDSVELDINQRDYALTSVRIVADLLKRISGSYSKYPAFAEVFPVLEQLLHFEHSNVAQFNANSLIQLASRLGLPCRFVMSSQLPISRSGQAQQRVLAICAALGADHYVNPIGGLALYSPEAFTRCGVRLSFLRTNAPLQLLKHESAHLSIIDCLMRHGFLGVREQLHDYALLTAESGVACD